MDADKAPELDELRRRLDSIDGAILDLVCERLGVVEQVAKHKSREGARLFHRSREEELIGARRDEARRRGVDPDAIENLFRQLILQSHRVQSDVIRAARPTEKKTIAIIGGAGGMGRFFARCFETLGHEVLIADVKTPLTPTDAAAKADVVMISVPIAVTVQVIEQVASKMRPDALLMDITSLKEGPVEAMLRCFPGEVVGTHPMFGPSAGALHRQVVAFCPARGERWAQWLRSTLESEGAEVVNTTPKVHDSMMAIIQVLRHFATIAFGRTLADLGADVAETLRYTSPIYRLELIMVGRLFGQDPELYADIILKNARGPEALEAHRRAVEELAAIAARADRSAFIEEFRRISACFGDFRERAMDESNYLIERMVDRM
ncbi:MAG: bifunctional chorismate mutase/prephenate dehydrogenase [Phycisphaeraceae bacterium]|nr:MAG: bifunctional chorismate mutase/prephenate dehydrogenase [Phycisphaeraceae bacterium]